MRTRKCKICKSEFQTNRASDCHCGDECRAESKRRHAREASKRKQLVSKRHQQEKQKKKHVERRVITSRVEREAAERVSTSVAIPPARKKNSDNCVGRSRLPVLSQAAKRICLKCQKKFDSIGKGNRICSTCQNSNIGLGGRETKFTPERGTFRGNY